MQKVVLNKNDEKKNVLMKPAENCNMYGSGMITSWIDHFVMTASIWYLVCWSHASYRFWLNCNARDIWRESFRGLFKREPDAIDKQMDS